MAVSLTRIRAGVTVGLLKFASVDSTVFGKQVVVFLWWH